MKLLGGRNKKFSFLLLNLSFLFFISFAMVSVAFAALAAGSESRFNIDYDPPSESILTKGSTFRNLIIDSVGSDYCSTLVFDYCDGWDLSGGNPIYNFEKPINGKSDDDYFDANGQPKSTPKIVQTIDVSQAGDQSIMFYATDFSNNFTVGGQQVNGHVGYVLSQGNILANEDCSYMFWPLEVSKLIFNNFHTYSPISHYGVKDMFAMFAKMYVSTPTETLDLSGFDMTLVENIDYMFANNSALKTVYVSEKWSSASVQSLASTAQNVFIDCKSLQGSKGTTYQSSVYNQYGPANDGKYAKVDDGSGYFTLKDYPYPF